MFALYPIKHDIGSASDDQLAQARLGSSSAQVRVLSKSFDYGNDSCRQPLCSFGLILLNVSPNAS